MADFLEAALRLPADAGPAWLDGLHQTGRKTWEAATFPTRKTEDWKYTSLRALERGDYLDSTGTLADVSAESLADRIHIADLGARTIVFMNGRYHEALSSAALPDGVELVRFAEADPEQAARIGSGLGSIARPAQHLFAALNDTRVSDGVYVRIRKNAKVAEPLQVVWVTVPQSQEFSVSQRLLVVMEEGSEATVVEHFTSDAGRQNCFTNGVTELVVGPNATLCHYRLHLEEEHALHIGGVHVSLARDAVFDSFHLAMGGKLTRVDVVVNHDGEGAECRLNGVYLPRHEQHVDFHTNIEHRVPRCRTTEVFRGVVADRARAVFNGRIHIHPDAQKTRAELSNKNLLTSSQAEVDAKPELEIYADDVQCAHGATVAQLDQQSIYYLCSRGIGRKEAEVMLSFGFINELVDKLHHGAVARYLRPILAAMFAHDSGPARDGP
jgi:Fe-S cluster assembly protein SufD